MQHFPVVLLPAKWAHFCSCHTLLSAVNVSPPHPCRSIHFLPLFQTQVRPSPPSFDAPISTSISGLFANQTPSVLQSPTCQEQLPDALLTTLLTTRLHLQRTSPVRAHRLPMLGDRGVKYPKEKHIMDVANSTKTYKSNVESKEKMKMKVPLASV